MHDAHYMARALQLARRGWYTARPNPRVGCVLVKDGHIVGEGYHEKAGEAHAEVNALAKAGRDSRAAVAYITLEPCAHHGRTPPCAPALIRAGIKRAVIAMPDPDPRVAGAGIEALREAGIEVSTGVLQEQAQALNRGFIRRMTAGRPYTRLKLAMSIDGRTAMASGESQWITSPQARADAHRLRAESGAVLTGIGTILADDPALNHRPDKHPRLQALLPAPPPPQPLRVVCDVHARTPPQAKVLAPPGRALFFTAPDADTRPLERAGAEVMRLPPDAAGKLPLAQVLRELAHREVNDVLIEAGAGLAGAFLQAALVDEMVVYMAPCLLGDGGHGLARLPGFTQMRDRLNLTITDLRACGPDWRISAVPVYHEGNGRGMPRPYEGYGTGT